MSEPTTEEIEGYIAQALHDIEEFRGKAMQARMRSQSQKHGTSRSPPLPRMPGDTLPQQLAGKATSSLSSDPGA